VHFYPTDTSWVEGGINFGSRNVRYVPKPRIALAWDRPTSSYSAGWARYVLEQSFSAAVTVVRTEALGRVDLDDFNVIVLPSGGGSSGSYSDALGAEGLEGLRRWIRGGGTLVALDRAVTWLASDDVGLLSAARRQKRNETDGDEAAEESPPLPETEDPAAIPGAILHARFDGDHWVGFGIGGDAAVLANNGEFFDPLTIDVGINVATFVDADELLLSGFVWGPERELVAGTPLVMAQPHGAGHVIAFTQDPNFRGYHRGFGLAFMNAVMFGPAF
jgi:hypothetical protein